MMNSEFWIFNILMNYFKFETNSFGIWFLQFEIFNFCFSQKLSVGRAGFEPAKVKPTDLQSVLVGRLSISPILGNSIQAENPNSNLY